MKTASKLLFICFIVFVANFAFAQQMDAKLNMAKRALTDIETKLTLLQSGDIPQYNTLSEQLSKAANLLQTTESKAHPDYISSIKKWSALREIMATKAQQWQSQTAQTAQTQETQTDTLTVSESQAATNNSSNRSNNDNRDAIAVDPDKILAKYQRDNRPKLPRYPNPSEVGDWATRLRALQTTELQQDLAKLQQTNVSQADANRVERWINGSFQQQIQQDLDDAMQSFNNLANTAVQLSAQIQSISQSAATQGSTNSNMRGYNIAQGENGRVNTQTLQNGLVASANAMALEEVFPALALSTRQQQIGAIAIAQQQLDELTQQANVTAKQLAALPKKQKPKKSEFLKGIAQKVWYKGSELASLDSKGSIWMNNQDIGDITSNGTIWVRGNDLGSIETNGKVWFRGNHIGTLEDNGKVWRSGSQVGLVESDGKVWVDGNKNGEIVPFEGEWKRAAILYFFSDIFKENS